MRGAHADGGVLTSVGNLALVVHGEHLGQNLFVSQYSELSLIVR